MQDYDMKDYDKTKEPSYLKYWDVNNYYRSTMSQKPPVKKFEWMEDSSQSYEGFIKNSHEESNEGYFLKVDIQYPEKLHKLYNDLPFLPERMKFEKIEKLVTSLHDKTEYVIYIRNVKQALNHELILKKVHRVIKFNQKAWVKSYIAMNTKLRQIAKNNFKKDFLKLMNNVVFGKFMKKNRNIKLVTTERKRNYLVSKPNYHTTNFFTENLLAIEMRKSINE